MRVLNRFIEQAHSYTYHRDEKSYREDGAAHCGVGSLTLVVQLVGVFSPAC